MIKPAPPQARGVAGLALLFCVVALIAGIGFDLLLSDAERFGVAAQPGGRAVLGIGVATICVLLAHAMRLLLGRAPRTDDGESG